MQIDEDLRGIQPGVLAVADRMERFNQILRDRVDVFLLVILLDAAAPLQFIHRILHIGRRQQRTADLGPDLRFRGGNRNLNLGAAQMLLINLLIENGIQMGRFLRTALIQLPADEEILFRFRLHFADAVAVRLFHPLQDGQYLFDHPSLPLAFRYGPPSDTLTHSLWPLPQNPQPFV